MMEADSGFPAGGGATHIENVARVAYEANRAWCAANGDDNQKPWVKADRLERENAIRGVMLVLASPEAGDSAQHVAWMSGQFIAGWRYGPVKDAEAKTHPCLVAFGMLPVVQQKKDALFRAVVRALV